MSSEIWLAGSIPAASARIFNYMAATEEFEKLLREYGGYLDRTKNHHVYKFPNGRIFVTSSTASDRRAADNNLACLKRFLNITKTKALDSGQPKEKPVYRPRHKKHELPFYHKNVNNDLADKLKIAGLTEEPLKASIETLENQNVLLTQELDFQQQRLEKLHLEWTAEIERATPFYVKWYRKFINFIIKL
jgi:hypothetical protein